MEAATIARVLCGVLAAIVLLAGCSPTNSTSAVRADQPDYAPGWNGVAVEGTPRLPDADFVDADSRPFDLRAAARDKPTLVYFGYTHCPDFCPVHMANIAQAMRDSSVRPEQVNVVLVTVDPERDTPEVLDAYLDNFHHSFIGLWAPQEEVNRVLVELGMPEPVRESEPGSDDYTIGHPTQLLAFDQDGHARLAYPFGTRQSQWVEDLPKLVRQDWPAVSHREDAASRS